MSAFKIPVTPKSCAKSGRGVPRASRVLSDDAVDGSAQSIGGRAAAPRYSAGPAVGRGGGRTIASGKGAVTESSFYQAFDEIPAFEIHSGRDLSQALDAARQTVMESNAEFWEKRMDAMKTLRAILKAGAINYDEFWVDFKLWSEPFQSIIKDLRSQVVREGCITIAYVCELLRTRADQFAEKVLPSIINIIQSSAKVMASSAYVCAIFVVRHVHSAKLVPIVAGYAKESKSREVRRACYELVQRLLEQWEPHVVDRHLPALSETIRNGLSDADGETRANSRKAYRALADNYREQAERLYSLLDPRKQREVVGDISAASSQASIARASQENLSAGPAGRFAAKQSAYYSNRSTSDIDAGAARRALARQHPSQQPYGGKHKLASITASPSGEQQQHAFAIAAGAQHGRAKPPLQPMNSLPRSRLAAGGGFGATPKAAAAPAPRTVARMGMASSMRTNFRMTPSKSVSQPGSRSNSPTGRTVPLSVAAAARRTPSRYAQTPSSGYGRQQASRDHSPARSHAGGSGGGTRRFSNESTSNSMNRALAFDALRSNGSAGPAVGVGAGAGAAHHRFNLDDFDEASQSSAGGGGPNGVDPNAYSPSSVGASVELSAALKKCAGQNWTDRKDGLGTLFTMFQQKIQLNAHEISRTNDTLTRLFVDQHTKTFTLFLDVLATYLMNYHELLCNWLHVVTMRLLTRLGAEALPSGVQKLKAVLNVVQSAFPYELQFAAIVKYVQDPYQTPSLKTKLAVLDYLCDLIEHMPATALEQFPDTRLALQKVIHWSSDQKSSEVRKAAQRVVYSFFRHNESEFTRVLATLPRHLQDQVQSIMATCQRRDRHIAARASMSPGGSMADGGGVDARYLNDRLRETTQQIHQYFAGAPPAGYNANMLGMAPVVGDKRNTGSQDSGIVDACAIAADSAHFAQRPEESVAAPTATPGAYSSSNGVSLTYSAGVLQLASALDPLKLAMDEEQQQEIIAEILSELSNHAQHVESRIKAMLLLNKMTKQGAFTLWDEHFKTILLLLLETLAGDGPDELKQAVLNLLKEICLSQASRFRDYCELTLLKVLDAHDVQSRDTQRAAESCALVLATHLPPALCIRTLNPVIKDAGTGTPQLLAAIRMMTKIIEQLSEEDVLPILSDVVPILVRAYEHNESSVRKAAVLGLVALHNCVGEQPIEPYMTQCQHNMKKLLQLYIKRSQTSSHSSAMS